MSHEMIRGDCWFFERGAAMLNHMNIFHIVDDEPAIRDLLQAMLQRGGYETVCFEDAFAYVSHMENEDYQPPTAILSDRNMPGMDGYALVHHVRQKLPQQKIVMISGDPNGGDEANEHLCYTLGKPFRMKEVLDLAATLSGCQPDGECRECSKTFLF